MRPGTVTGAHTGWGDRLFPAVSQQGFQDSPVQRTILVRQQASRPASGDDPLRELAQLARSAGAEIRGAILSIRARATAPTYIGKGKVDELAALVKQQDAGLVIFDHAISPIQERNIERQIQCRVLDRSGLILDIFAQRATTSEGKLQVEMAQLQHLSTRLVRGWTHLERQKGGIGLRGPGESQLETDRRLLGRRIKTLRRRLARLELQRGLRRRARQRAPVPTVSLVGYTNAGKSALFNALTGDNTLVEDQLFATLDPTMRRVTVPGFGDVVLSDTVGFVRDLPHTLVAAFHSTLEEVTSASCLLLVSDVANPDAPILKAEVAAVLQEIGAGDIPAIQVHNKIDLTDTEPQVKTNADGMIDGVWLAATKGQGLENLLTAIGALLGKDHVRRDLTLEPCAGGLRARLYEKCEVLRESVDEVGVVKLALRMDAATWGWLQGSAQYRGMWRQAN